MKKLIFKASMFSILLFTGLTANAQIFYKIEKPGVEKPSYIFGSHHLSPIDIVEKASVSEYFGNTDQVIGELDLTVNPMEIAMAVQSHMMAPQDSSLTKLLAGQDIDKLNDQFQKFNPTPGLTLQMLDPMKPMAVTTMIALSMSQEVMPGYDPNQQLDTYFMKEGKAQGKNIIGLETPEYQGTVLFDSTPLTVQAENLIEMLTKPEDAIEATKKLTEAYRNRDLDKMLELSKESDDNAEFMEAILYKRNADWLTKLPTLIEDTPSFIVVGALHLAGPEGVLEGLMKEGFILTPIY